MSLAIYGPAIIHRLRAEVVDEAHSTSVWLIGMANCRLVFCIVKLPASNLWLFLDELWTV